MPYIPAIDAPKSCIPREKIENDCYDWYERHKAKCREAASSNHDIVLCGDSITHFWEDSHGPNTWKQLFTNRNVMNLGFGWDRTCNVLYRLDNGEFTGQTPKLFVLNIGTNNFGDTINWKRDTPEDVAKGISAIMNLVHEMSPHTVIAVMAVFQRGISTAPFRELIRKLNAILTEQLSPLPYARLINFSEEFLLPGSNELDTSLFRDTCHLQEKGYRLWAKYLEQLFCEFGL